MSKIPSTARLVTWNINSVRFRLDLVDRFIRGFQPDILCLQETKAQDDQFPLKWFEERGFKYTALHGQKSYHGVAILSKLPFSGPSIVDWCSMGDARHVQVTLPGGAVLHNVYAPAGGDEPNPKTNPKFDHKLRFFDEMIAWSAKLQAPSILVGDLNIAPYENDVWSHKQLLKVVSHTPVETERMMALLESHDWIDVMRDFVPKEEKLFTWWSYRARDWLASNKGRRLDHIWLSPSLKGTVQSLRVGLDARGWEKPSDHAPVIADILL